MNTLASLIRDYRAGSCVECGKCSAACSMPAMYPDFSNLYSPRGFVRHCLDTAVGLPGESLEAYLWRCLQCGNCTLSCPEGVDCAGLIKGLREAVIIGEGAVIIREGAVVAREDAAGSGPADALYCSACGREVPGAPVRRIMRDLFAPDIATNGDGDKEHDPPAYLTLCHVCRRQVYAANNAGKAREDRP